MEFLTQRDQVDVTFKEGDQLNTFSELPYTPFPIDKMYGLPTNSPPCCYDQIGRDVLPEMYTRSAFTGQEALWALERLITDQSITEKPFSLAVHFQPPHPPCKLRAYYLFVGVSVQI